MDTLLNDCPVGTSAQSFNEEVGRLFQGSEEPSLNGLNQDNDPQISEGIYFKDNAPLYSHNGVPKAGDVYQGELGDCYLLACLAAVANANPSAIKNMIVANPNGTYGVRFYDKDGLTHWQTVTDMIPSEAALGGTSKWVALIEKAWVLVRCMSEEVPIAYGQIAGGSDCFQAVTGREPQNYDAKSYNANDWKNSVVPKMVDAVNLHLPLVVGTGGKGPGLNKPDGAGQYHIISEHVYTVIGYNAATAMFTLQNPWPLSAEHARIFEMSGSQLQSIGDGGSITIGQA
jgi:hypothetical protein